MYGEEKYSNDYIVSSEVCTGALHNSNHIYQIEGNEKLISPRKREAEELEKVFHTESTHACSQRYKHQDMFKHASLSMTDRTPVS